MAVQVQWRRGTTAQNNAFTGALGEVTVDTDLDVLRVHDGSTAGGFALVGTTATQTITNKTITIVGNLTTAGITPTANATSNIGNVGAYYSNIFAVTYNVGTGGIVNAGANATGNIGSSTTYFNTIFAKATSAQYADLAERYQADAEYPVGTVLVFGGDYEVTESTKDHDTAIAGVVSAEPAYLMNSTLQTPNSVTLALAGRVPCRVQGPVNKGTVLVSSNIPGVAQAIDYSIAQLGSVVGKAMQAIQDHSVQTIEVAVGRN